MSGESGESSGGEREPEPAAGCGPAAWGTAAPPVYESGCHRPTEPAGGGLFWGEPQWEQGLSGGAARPPDPSREQWDGGECWELLLTHDGFTLLLQLLSRTRVDFIPCPLPAH